MRVHIHLARGLDLKRWREGYESGKFPDASPYGYHHLDTGNVLSWSCDKPENLLAKYFRLVTKRLLGFDLVHAWRNRKLWSDADVIITHTEYEGLAVNAVRRLSERGTGGKPRQIHIGQTVWLIDRWTTYGNLHRSLYGKLLGLTQVNITLSPINAGILSEILGGVSVRFVPFGISLDSFPICSPNFAPGKVIKLLALGNDVHRDWATLASAFANDAGFQVTVASRTFDPSIAANSANIVVVRPDSVHAIRDLYDDADLIVVPLSANQHASGVTVVLEAIARGKPVVCTRVGGIDAYFTSDEIFLCAPDDPVALKEAVQATLIDSRLTQCKTEAAQRRFLLENYSSAGYAERVLECATVGSGGQIG